MCLKFRSGSTNRCVNWGKYAFDNPVLNAEKTQYFCHYNKQHISMVLQVMFDITE
jgi:hypothetical protein